MELYPNNPKDTQHHQIKMPDSPQDGEVMEIPRVRQIDVEICEECPAECGFCATVQAPATESIDDRAYIKSFETWLPSLVEKSGCMSLIFTGGEPTLPRYVNRLIECIKICNEVKTDWEVLAVITNGAFLPKKFNTEKTYAQALADAGLKQFTWSVAHYSSEINRYNYGQFILDLNLIAEAINQTGLPFRVNTILQRDFIENPDDLLNFINWGFNTNTGAESIYVRELFEYVDIANRSPQGVDVLKLDRDPRAYYHSHHIDSQIFIDSLSSHSDFKLIANEKEDLRDKSTITFQHLPTSKKVLLTRLEIGNENIKAEESPYLVFGRNGKPRISWQGDPGENPNLNKYTISKSVLN